MSTQPLHTTQIDQLPVSVYATNEALGAAAADEAAEAILAAVAARGGIKASIGSIASGKRADLAVFDDDFSTGWVNVEGIRL